MQKKLDIEVEMIEISNKMIGINNFIISQKFQSNNESFLIECAKAAHACAIVLVRKVSPF